MIATDRDMLDIAHNNDLSSRPTVRHRTDALARKFVKYDQTKFTRRQRVRGRSWNGLHETTQHRCRFAPEL